MHALSSIVCMHD